MVRIFAPAKVLITLCAIAVPLSYLWFSQKSLNNKPSVRILTYSSFVSGAGSRLAEVFEKNCDCNVEYINGNQGQLLKSILQLNPSIDLVVGLDELTILNLEGNLLKSPEAKEYFSDLDFISTVRIKRDIFIPYDWSPLGFIVKNNKSGLPKSWKGLFDTDLRVGLQDPRFSTPGMIFQYWFFRHYKKDDLATFYKNFHKKNVHYSPSWTASYALFQQNKIDLVFTYLSSLIYHWENENDKSHQFLVWKSHPVHREYAALTKFCKKCDLAESFLKLMLSPKGQKIIVQKNYMLPVLKGMPYLKELKKFSQIVHTSDHRWIEFSKNQKNIIKIWKDSL